MFVCVKTMILAANASVLKVRCVCVVIFGCDKNKHFMASTFL